MSTPRPPATDVFASKDPDFSFYELQLVCFCLHLDSGLKKSLTSTDLFISKKAAVM